MRIALANLAVAAVVMIGSGIEGLAQSRDSAAESDGNSVQEKVRWHHLYFHQISSARVRLDPTVVYLCYVPINVDVPAGPHKEGAALVYANDAALKYRRDHPEGRDYPIGSTFMKDKYDGMKAPDPHLATVMKRVGDKGGIGDWEFSVLSLPSGDEQKLDTNQAAACADCHSGFEARGFVSRHTDRSLKDFLKTWKGPSVVTEARPNEDSKGFLELGAEAEKLREQRLLSALDFARLASRKDTLILDARSRADFARQHVAGAVNLPYTEFNPDALAELIPSQDTPVLIYCSNNINYPQPEPEAKKDPKGKANGRPVFIGGSYKGRKAALNIPTFITLYGYGYRNLYELGPSVVPGESVIRFVADK